MGRREIASTTQKCGSANIWAVESLAIIRRRPASHIATESVYENSILHTRFARWLLQGCAKTRLCAAKKYPSSCLQICAHKYTHQCPPQWHDGLSTFCYAIVVIALMQAKLRHMGNLCSASLGQVIVEKRPGRWEQRPPANGVLLWRIPSGGRERHDPFGEADSQVLGFHSSCPSRLFANLCSPTGGALPLISLPYGQ
jgi:hypothetical protein